MTSERGIGAPSPHRGAVTTIGLFVLLLSLLGPMLSLESANAAQGVPPTCDPGFVVSDDGATCVPDPNTQPATETPTETATATETPTEEIIQSTVAATEVPVTTYRLTINVYRCDHPEFDPYFSGNAQMVIDQCVLPGSGTFTIESTMAVPQQTGTALEFQIGPGLAIQEMPQPGYDNPIANCFLYDANGNLADQIGPGQANGGYWKVGSVAGDVHCDWYQVDRGVGVVYVVNMACPSTAGLFPEPSYDELVSMCSEPAGGRQFFVGHGAGLTRMGVSGGEFNDVLFDAIQAGPIEIWLDDPSGFDKARVFCQVTTIDGAPVSPFAEVGVTSFRATGLTLVHGQRIHCSWFNIEPMVTQGDGPSGPVEPTPGTTPADLTIAIHTCPASYDPLAPGADPTIDCAPGPNGITFTLSDADPGTNDQQATTGDSVDNAVTFGGLAPGDYTAVQATPAGIESSFVLGCGGGGDIDPLPIVVDGPQAITLPPGVILTCPWFNVPAADANQAVAAAIPGTGSLTMAVYTCPAGFDVSTVNANPQASCAPAPNIELEMDDSIDDGGGWAFSTDATGTSTITGLGADTYSITEGARNGTTATFVWDCYDAAGSSARTDPLTMGTTLTYELADGAQIRCDWFNVVGGAGRVIVNSHACASDVSAYTLSYEQLGTACTADPGTIDYTVVSDTHQETQPASQNPLTLASFANVPSGYVAVVEAINTTWAVPVVWCQVNLEDATVVSPPTRQQVYVGRQVNFGLEPGQVVFCDWYNIPLGDTQVLVTNHACPAGFDAYTADPTALAANCTADPGTIDFTVEDGKLFLQTKPVPWTTPIVYSPVPAGDLRISAKLPATWGVPVVICKVDHQSTNVVPPTSITVSNGPSIRMSLSPDQQLSCDWYNVPGGLGMVSIWTQACPAGFDAANATPLQLEQRCNEDIETVDYTLTSGSFTQTASSTNLFRYADFPAVPAGTVTVTGALPHGSDTPVVWCRVQQEGQPVTQPKLAEVTNGATITWPLEAGQWLICRWYNLVETDSTVTVVKWICPDGAPQDQTYAWYTANCTQKHAGVAFTLTHSGGSAPGATDANGQIQWPDVPLGPFSIQEQIPKDYGEPVVFCAAGSDVALAQFQRKQAPGGYLQGELTTGRTLYTCAWFNIYPGPGTVTIHKYTCPPGYDLHAAGVDPKFDCAAATNGVTFTLTGIDPTVAPVQGTTGDAGEGAVTFNDLEPGTYHAEETVPPGTEFAFVLDCTGGKMGAIRAYPLATGSSIDIPVGAGESIACSWYNVPGYDDGRLTVIKYHCATMTYTSDVDCEIDEGGRAFDLLAWNGSDWEVHATRTTDGAGRVTFDGLATGQYWLDEHDGAWCHLASDRLTGDDQLDVEAGQETIVSVYNCGDNPDDVGKIPPIPTKFPNTGVTPSDHLHTIQTGEQP